jgi:uncharacterized protein involved in exopolysaccharide biosynthesis
VTDRYTVKPTVQPRRFWRVAIAALIGAILGFGVSFLFGVKYTADTRVLLRINNTAYFEADGSTITQQGTAFDTGTLSKIISETEGTFLQNDVAAKQLVAQLHLDRNPAQKGVIAALKRNLASGVKVLRGLLQYGMYKSYDSYDTAVKAVDKGLKVTQVGNSLMLDVSGQWKSPEDAKALANAGANYLVKYQNERINRDVATNVAQVEQAAKQQGVVVQQATNELAQFALANNLDLANIGITLTPQNAQKLTPDQQQTLVALQQAYTTAVATQTQIQARLQAVQANSLTPPVQLTRVDTATVGLYPTSPKRWLWMAIGIVLGSIAGLIWTARVAWSYGETLFPHDEPYGLDAFNPPPAPAPTGQGREAAPAPEASGGSDPTEHDQGGYDPPGGRYS